MCLATPEPTSEQALYKHLLSDWKHRVQCDPNRRSGILASLGSIPLDLHTCHVTGQCVSWELTAVGVGRATAKGTRKPVPPPRCPCLCPYTHVHTPGDTPPTQEPAAVSLTSVWGQFAVAKEATVRAAEDIANTPWWRRLCWGLVQGHLW
jgi:hypothetical protein